MKKIVYIGTYLGFIGGIERYMQQSAQLLRRSGLAVHCLYLEQGGREQQSFADSFDSIQKFSPEKVGEMWLDLIKRLTEKK